MSERRNTTRIHFTKKAIENLPLPKVGRVHIYDEQVRDLGLRIEANGRRSFFWFRKVRGHGKFRAIGKFPATSIENARGKAQRLSGDLDRLKNNDFQGPNPFERQRGEPTLDELIEEYCTRGLTESTRPEKMAKIFRWQRDKYLSPWKNRKMSSIRRKDVAEIHRQIREKHGIYSANRVLQLMKAAYFFAEREEIWDGANPCRGIKITGEVKRDRYLSKEELARLFTALRDSGNVDLQDYVWLSLATGARKMDVLSMRWTDVRLEENSWRVPHPKGDVAYVVPLMPEAIKILRERKTRANGNDFVFPSTRGTSGHLTDLRNSWWPVLEAAKLSDVRQHDLRRTLGSFQADQNVSLPIIGKSLGHAAGSPATAIYARLQLEPVAASVRRATRSIFAASRKKTSQKSE